MKKLDFLLLCLLALMIGACGEQSTPPSDNQDEAVVVIKSSPTKEVLATDTITSDPILDPTSTAIPASATAKPSATATEAQPESATATEVEPEPATATEVQPEPAMATEVQPEPGTATSTATVTMTPTQSPTKRSTMSLSDTATLTDTGVLTDTTTLTDTRVLTDTTTQITLGTPSPSATPTITATTEAVDVIETPELSITLTSTPNSSGEIIHIVGVEETLYSIAVKYGVLTTQLGAYNNFPGLVVEQGQEVRIPVGMMSQSYIGSGARVTSTPLPVAINENQVVLGPVSFDWQKLNNCGPTTTHVMLSYYGINQPQLTIAGILKPNPNDKNVSPSEVANYVRGQGLGAFIGVNGDIELLERLLSAGYPVMVEQWMQYDGGVGHYRAVRGFNRTNQQILQEDTFLGPDIWRSYDEFNRDWSYFNNTYLVFYPPEDEGAVAKLIGNDWSHAKMWERALSTFDEQTNGLGLYGKAEALHQLGRDSEAVSVYLQALEAGLPARYFWYRFGYFEALNSIGQHKAVTIVTEPVLQAMVQSEDIRYQRAIAYKAMGQTSQARRELNIALQDNPNFIPARTMLNQLPVQQPTQPPLPTWTAAPPATWTPAPPATWTPAPIATWTPIPFPTWTPIPFSTWTPIPFPTWTPVVEQPTEVPAPEQPTEVPAPEQPTEVPAPEQPTEVPVPEQPTEVPVPEQPTEEPVPEQPTEVPVPEQPTEVPVLEQPTEVPAPEPEG